MSKQFKMKMKRWIATILIICMLPIVDYVDVFANPETVTMPEQVANPLSPVSSDDFKEQTVSVNEEETISVNAGEGISDDNLESTTVSVNAMVSEDKKFALSWIPSTVSDCVYQVYRNDELVAEGVATEYKEENIIWGNDYTYQIKVKAKTGEIIGTSEPETYSTVENLEPGWQNYQFYSKNIIAGSLTFTYCSMELISSTLLVLGDIKTGYCGIQYSDSTIDCGGDFVVSENGFISDDYNQYLTDVANASENGQVVERKWSHIITNSDVIWNSSQSEYMGNTFFELKGNYTNTVSTNCIKPYSLVFSGIKKQEVVLNGSEMYTNELVLRNQSLEGINTEDMISFENLVNENSKISEVGKELAISDNIVLTQDVTIEGDYHLYGGRLDLNGHVLQIKGNFYQEGGNVFVNNGKLLVGEDYRIQNVKKDGSFSKSFGALYMNQESDYVSVGKNFVCNFQTNHFTNEPAKEEFTKGILEIKGDFIDESNSDMKNHRSFHSSGTHKIILSGDAGQKFVGILSKSNENGEVVINDTKINAVEIKNNSMDGAEFINHPLICEQFNTNNCKTSGLIGVGSTTSLSGNEVCGLYLYDSYLFPENISVIKGNIEVGNQEQSTEKSDKQIIVTHDVLIDGNVNSEISANAVELTISGNVSSRSIHMKQGSKIKITGNCILEDSYQDALQMISEEDYLLVNGDFTNESSVSGYHYENGTIEVKGNIVLNPQMSEETKIGKYIMSGDSLQTICAGTMSESSFYLKSLHLKNTSAEGIILKSIIHAENFVNTNTKVSYEGNSGNEGAVAGWKLEKDEVIEGDLLLGSGTLDLNGKKLTIKGNFIQCAGELAINNGSLEVEGDYRIQNQYKEDQNVVYGLGLGTLKMVNEKDAILVKGNFYNEAMFMDQKNFTNGFLEVKGNYNNLTKAKIAPKNLILSGADTQTVTGFVNNLDAKYETSRRTIKFIDNPVIAGLIAMNGNDTYGNIQITDSTEFQNNTYPGTVFVNENKCFIPNDSVISGLYINSESTLSGNFIVKGTLENKEKVTILGTVEADQINVKNSFVVFGDVSVKYYYNQYKELIVYGNFTNYVTGGWSYETGETIVCGTYVGKENLGFNSDAPLIMKNGTLIAEKDFVSTSYISMSNPNDKILVKGRFDYFNDNGQNLSDGVLELKGEVNFDPMRSVGNHKIILSGDQYQSVNGGYPSSCNYLEINNTSAEGVHFQNIVRTATPIVWKNGKVKYGTVVGSPEGTMGYTLSENTVINDSFILQEGVLDLNGHTLTIEGDFTQNSGTIFVNGGELIVKGNFDQARKNYYDEIYGNGILKMTNPKDKVSIYGTVYLDFFRENSEQNLTAGTLTLYGNSLSFYNYRTSGNHTTAIIRDFSKNNGNYFQNAYFNTDNCHIKRLQLEKDMDSTYYFSKDKNTIAEEIIYGEVSSTLPKPITSISANQITETTVNFTFSGATDDLGIDHYEIYRDGVKIGSTKQQEYKDTGLEANTEYTYTVFAQDSNGNIAPSSPSLKVKTSVDTELPQKVNNIWVSDKTGSRISLEWNYAFDNVRVVGYDLYRDGVLLKADISPNSSNGLLLNITYTDLTVEKNKTYTYYVIAKDKSGNQSEASNEISANVVMPEILSVFPEDNTTIGGNVFRLAVNYKKDWASSNKVRIAYKNKTSLVWTTFSYVQSFKTEYNNNFSVYVDCKLNAITYENIDVRYTVIDKDNNSTSQIVTYQIDKTAPETPVSVNAICTKSNIDISWKASKDATSYYLFRKESVNGTYFYVSTVNATTYRDTSAAANKQYFYVVSAVDKFGQESAESEAVEAMKDSIRPVVSGVSLSEGKLHGICELNVTATDNQKVDKIKLYLKKEGSSTNVLLAEQPYTANMASFWWNTKQYEDGKYELEVVATDICGNVNTQKVIKNYVIDNTGIQKIVIKKNIVGSKSVWLYTENIEAVDFAYLQIEQLKGETFEKIAEIKEGINFKIPNLTPKTAYSFRIVGYDTIGNRGVESDVISVVTVDDQTKPVINQQEPEVKNYNSNIELEMAVSDNQGIDYGTFSYSLDKTTYTEIEKVYSISKGTSEKIACNFDVSNLPEGPLYVRFEAFDTSENHNVLIEKDNETKNVEFEYSIDHTAPNGLTDLKAVSKEGYVSLSWPKSSSEDVKTYRIYRKAVSDNSYSVLVSSCELMTYFDTSGVENATYQYQITAIDTAGNESVVSNVVEGKVLPHDIAPTTVSIISANEITDSSITIHFEGAVDEDGVVGYEIYRNGEKIAVTSNQEYVDKGLKPNTKYEYTVFGFDTYKNIAKESPKCVVTTKVDVEAPMKVEDLGVKTRSGSAITLTWSASKDNNKVAGYDIYRNGEVIASKIKDTFYKDENLSENTLYKYYVIACDEAGNSSDVSNVVDATIFMPKITSISPVDYDTVGGEKITLNVHFKNSGNSIGNKVKIEYYNTDSKEWITLTKTLLEQKEFSQTESYADFVWNISEINVEGDLAVRYTVIDIDQNKTSEEVSYILDRQAPKEPQNFTAVDENGTIKLNWIPSSSADCEGYILLRLADENGTYEEIATIKGKSTNYYTDSKIESGKKYTYVVRAFDKFNQKSILSNTAFAVGGLDFECPKIISMEPGAGRIPQKTSLKILGSDNRFVQKIELYVRNIEEEDWILLSEQTATNNKSEYLWDTSALPDGTYFVNAVAIDAAGNKSEQLFTRRYEIDHTGIKKIVLEDSIIASTCIQLNWKDVDESDFGYFQVEKYEEGKFVKLAEVKDKLGYAITGLQAETEYTFRVVGYDNLGNRGTESDIITEKTLNDLIGPSITSIFPVSSSYKDIIKLQMYVKDNAGIDYGIFSYSTDNVNFTNIQKVYAKNKSNSEILAYDWNVSNLPNGKIYIKFESYDTSGNHNVLLQSGESIVNQYEIDHIAPEVVENVKAKGDEGFVSINWDLSLENDIKCYRIYRASMLDKKFEVISAECTSKNYIDSIVKYGESYLYKVSAIDIAGNESILSDEVVASVLADETAPIVRGISPKDGEILGQNATLKFLITDNHELKEVQVDYREAGTNNIWNQLFVYDAKGISDFSAKTWDTSKLSEGVTYEVRTRAVDSAGNISDYLIRNYSLDLTATEKPVLTTNTGSFVVDLNWTENQEEDFTFYKVFRKEVNEKEYTCLNQVNEAKFQDKSAEPNILYYYKIQSFDEHGNMSESVPITGFANNIDTVSPNAFISEGALVGVVGREVAFDGGGSSDNVRIVDYTWTIKEDKQTILKGMRPVYTFNKAGTYDVVLTVKDAAGNTSMTTVSVMILDTTNAGQTILNVTDMTGKPLPYASIHYKKSVGDNNTEDVTLQADGNGRVTLSAYAGGYTVSAYAPGYLPTEKTVYISNYEVLEETIQLKSGDVVSGELTIERMELQDLISSGVDLSDPENYHTFTFKTTLTFAEKPYPLEVYGVQLLDTRSEVSSSTSYTKKDNSNPTPFEYEIVDLGAEGYNDYAVIYLETTQSVSWLKDVYAVNLGIINNADSQYKFTGAMADLKLPDGLSLAKTANEQSMSKGLGEIAGQEEKRVTWVVSGDKSGSYDIEASFYGILSPFDLEVTKTFKCNKEFEVKTGEGIHIYIMPENAGFSGADYYIQYKIVNESDRTFYNFTTTIGDYEKPQNYIVEEVRDVLTEEKIARWVRKCGTSYRISTANEVPKIPILYGGDKIEVGVFEPNRIICGTYSQRFPETGKENVDVYYKLAESLVKSIKGKNLGVKVTVIPINTHLRYRLKYEFVNKMEFGPIFTIGDPIDMSTGAFKNELQTLEVYGKNSLSFGIHYNSMLSETLGENGYGWTNDYEKKVVEEGSLMKVYLSSSSYMTFINENAKNKISYGSLVTDQVVLNSSIESYGSYCALGNNPGGYTMEKKKDGSYELKDKDGKVIEFDSFGNLSKIKNIQGSEISVVRTDKQIEITDLKSKNFIIGKYDAQGHIISITDNYQRNVTLKYESDNLVSITNIAGDTTSFRYDEKHHLIEGTNANGVVYVQNEYDEMGRVTTQRNANPEAKPITIKYEDLMDGGTKISATNHNGEKSILIMNSDGLVTKIEGANGATSGFTYDSKGLVITKRDAYNNAIINKYDEKSNLIEVSDTAANKTYMEYDDNRNCISIKSQDGSGNNFTYNDKNQKTSIVDSLGCKKIFEYNSEGYVTKQTTDGLGTIVNQYENNLLISTTDYNGNIIRYEYDNFGRLVKTIDPKGAVSTTEYDILGRMIAFTDESGATTSYTYDKLGFLTSKTDAKGNKTRYLYSDSGIMEKEIAPDGGEIVYRYDGEDRLLSITYPDNSSERCVYDSVGNVIQKVQRDGSIYKYEYDLLNRLVKETIPNGNSTSYEYFPNGKISKVNYADGETISYTYDNNWRLVRETHNGKNSICYTYDIKGNMTSASDVLGNTEKSEYDNNGRVIKATDARGNITTYKYDGNGNCIESKNALGVITSFTYDELNRMIKVISHTDQGDVSVSYKYDSVGRVVETTNEEGKISKVSYDMLGNVEKVTDAMGNIVTKNTYDSLNQLTETVDALGTKTKLEYDKVGNLITTIECLNTDVQTKTNYQYDQGSKLINVTDPLENNCSYTYDLVGNITTVTSAKGGKTTYNYDELNRLIKTVSAIGSEETYTYNAEGLLAEKKNARNQETSYEYDVTGKIIKIKDELGTIEYSYDEVGNVTKVSDKNGSITRTYDELNRVTSVTDYKGNTIKYAYDQLGNRILLTYPGGEIVRYTYTKTGNIATVTDNKNRITYYDYDANGRLIQTVRPDGTVEKRSYDTSGQLIKIEDKKANNIIHEYVLEYDEAGNIIKSTDNTTTKVDLSSLSNAVMTYDADNRLITYNGAEVKYDPDGNMIYGPLNGEMVTFTYDCRNRLIKAGDTCYEYNAENTRTAVYDKEKKEEYLVDSEATYSQILTATTYKKNIWGVFDEQINQKILTYGIGLISEESKQDGYLLYHFDQIGSTKVVTDEKGSIIYRFEYGSYGETLSVTDGIGRDINKEDVTVSFCYNGQVGVVTDQNGLYYMRARYYHTDIKRFINRDVITGSIDNSQSLNQYCYVQGNPIRNNDPFGLCPDGSGVQQETGRETLFDWQGIKKFFKDQIGAQLALKLDSSPQKRLDAYKEVCKANKDVIEDTKQTGKNLVKAVVEMPTGKKVHLALSILGCIPEIGALFDLADGIYYLCEGNGKEAIFSFGSAATSLVPYLGQAADATKIAKYANVFDETIDIAKAVDTAVDGAKDTDIVVDALKETYTIGMCFTAETLVKVAKGHKAISEIKVGDYVYSENVATGEKAYKKVKQVFVNEVTTLYHIKIADQEIKTTAPHPFYVIGKGWVEAEDLVVGDQLKLANGETTKVEAITIEKLKTPVKVYNFEVEDWHVYYVSNLEVLVHNKGGPCSADNMVKEVVEGGLNISDDTLKWLNKGDANNIVYYGVKDGEAVYTGITKQDIAKRLYQHNYGPNGKGLDYLEAQMENLTRNQARAIEQYLIENGPANALNKANSISPTSQYYDEALQWAKNYLENLKK